MPRELTHSDDLSAAGPVARLLLPLAFVALSFWLGLQHNQFSFFYHSDESAKVDQVISADYNFHHPMLLLMATRARLGGGPVPEDMQRVVEAGRWMAAAFTALAVGALVSLALQNSGGLAGLAAGLLLAFNQQLFELAHYMKEDPGLLLGVALTFLALALYERHPGWPSALACGAACGIAVSGKYVGVIMLAAIVPVIWRAPATGGRRRVGHGLLVLGGAILVFALLNIPLLADQEAFQRSFQREVDMVAHGSKGMTRSVPHAVYFDIFADNTTPVVWLLLGAFYYDFWRRRRALGPAAWVTALFPIVLTLGFSFFPKTNDRYYLPVTAILYYLAALGLVSGARWMTAWKPRWPLPAIAAFLLVVALASEAPRFWDVYRAFQRDDRRELAELIRDRVPAEAKIAQDSRVMLPDERNRNRGRVVLDLPQTIESEGRYVSGFGDLDQISAAGFTYVAVSESNYGRFFVRSMIPKDKYLEEYERQRAFYERLFREGELIFERPRSTVIYLHPGLRLYRLPSAESGG